MLFGEASAKKEGMRLEFRLIQIRGTNMNEYTRFDAGELHQTGALDTDGVWDEP